MSLSYGNVNTMLNSKRKSLLTLTPLMILFKALLLGASIYSLFFRLSANTFRGEDLFCFRRRQRGILSFASRSSPFK